MQILDKKPFYVSLFPGDTFHLRFRDEYGVESTILTEEITEALEVDTVMVFRIEKGDLGLEAGIGGAFGKSCT